MPRLSRAAQFSPFAALTGYDDLVSETARLTDEQVLLSEESKASLNDALTWLVSQSSPVEATFTYFVPDKTKAGGSYSKATGRIKKYDASSRILTLETGDVMPIEHLCRIECPAYERELLSSCSRSKESHKSIPPK